MTPALTTLSEYACSQSADALELQDKLWKVVRKDHLQQHLENIQGAGYFEMRALQTCIIHGYLNSLRTYWSALSSLFCPL